MLTKKIFSLLFFFAYTQLFCQTTTTTINYSNLTAGPCVWSSATQVSSLDHEKKFGGVDIVTGAIRLYTKEISSTPYTYGTSFKISKNLTAGFFYTIKVTCRASQSSSGQIFGISAANSSSGSSMCTPESFPIVNNYTINNSISTSFAEYTLFENIAITSNTTELIVNVVASSGTAYASRHIDIQKIVIEETPCNLASPSSLTLTPNSSPPSIVATWPAVSGAPSYSVKRRVSSGPGSWTAPVVTPSLSNTFSGLTFGTTYDVSVSSRCSNGQLSFPERISTTTVPCPSFGAATALVFSQTGAFTGNISFNQMSGLTNTVQFKKTTETSWTSVASSNNTASLTGLMSNTTYQARVITTCTGASTQTSGTITFTLQCSIGNLTPTISMSNISYDAAQANMTAQMTGNVYQYEYKKTTLSNWTIVSSSTPNITLSGLTEGTSYHIRLKISCNSVWSPYSSITTFQTLPYCPVPLIQLTSGTSYSQDAFCYQSNYGTYFWNYKKTTDTNWNVATGGSNITMLPLQSNTQYQVKVKFNCSQGSSPFSSVYNFTTGAPCSSAPNFSIQSTTPGVANVSSYVTGATTYLWEYKLNSSPTWITSAGGQNVNFSSLTSGQLYNFRLRVSCTGGLTSTYSNIKSITVL